jgi:hypothetical protein
MALTADERQFLIKLISEHASLTQLANVAARYNLFADYSKVEKAAPSENPERMCFLAEKIVDASDLNECLHAVAHYLYGQNWKDDEFANGIAPFAVKPRNAHQGAIASRSHFIMPLRFRKGLDETLSRVCVVMTAPRGPHEGWSIGTGFLVGPDLVLTACHVVDRYIDENLRQAPAPPQGLLVVFDHFEGDPIVDDAFQGGTRIPFHDNWLVACSPKCGCEGEMAPQEAQAAMFGANLDFALIRLSQQAGYQSRRDNGGERRRWISVAAQAPMLQVDARITIPQHPQGASIRMDIGRRIAGGAQSRIRYDAETDDGSSGAPCLDEAFRLVGLHTAEIRSQPTAPVIANQAVSLAAISPALLPHLNAAANAVLNTKLPTLFVDESKKRVILGRKTFMEWVEFAAAEELVKDSRRRIYAALSLEPRSGRTFTIDILRALRRGRADVIAVIGDKREPVPEFATDFVRLIGEQLAIPADQLARMPARPSAHLPLNSLDGDKLKKWASDDLPLWFADVLKAHRERRQDPRLYARRIMQEIELIPEAVRTDANKRALAAARDVADAAPVADQDDYYLIWVALEDFSSQRISAEVRDFIAGLLRDRDEEAWPEVRRLRWLFLGSMPEFLASDQITSEAISAQSIGVQQLMENVSRYADTRYRKLKVAFERNLMGLFEAIMRIDAFAGDLSDASQRLEALQQCFLALMPYFDENMEALEDG